MVSKPKCSPDSVKADETNASKDREIAGLKSSLAMLLAAFKLMSSQAGFKMPELNSDDPFASCWGQWPTSLTTPRAVLKT